MNIDANATFIRFFHNLFQTVPGRIFLLCTVALIFLFFYLQKRKRKADDLWLDIKPNNKNYLYILYKLYNAMPGINKIFRKIKFQITQLYPADSISINKKATALMSKALCLCLLGLVFVIAISSGDLFYIGTGVIGIYILMQHFVNGKLQKMEDVLLEQFSLFLSRVSAKYDIALPIEDVIGEVLENLPYEIKIHISKIHEILVKADSETAMKEYIITAPFDFIIRFLAFAVPTKEYGDKQERDGISAFKENLTFLIEDIHDELLHRQEVKALFSAQNIFIIVAIFSIKPLQLYNLYFFTPTASFYNGIWGIVIMVGILFLCLMAYSMISSLRYSKRKALRTKSVWRTISNHKAISFWLNKEINKHYTRHERIDEMMKKSGDQTGPKAFLLKRLVFAACGFLTGILMFTVIDMKAQQKILSDFVDTFSESVLPSEAYQQTMQEASETLTKQYHRTHLTEDNRQSLQSQIADQYNITNQTYANQIIDTVLERIEEYQSTYYKWYYVVISCLLAMIGYGIPYQFLKYNQNLVEMTKEDEINQFNSLIMMLMNMDGMLLETMLEWLNYFAFYYKKPIMECLVTLNQNQNLAIANLKNADSEFPPWVIFVERMENIDSKGVKEAFMEIKNQRAYFIQSKNRRLSEITHKNASRAWRIAFTTIILIFLLWLMLPICIYMYNLYLPLKSLTM